MFELLKPLTRPIEKSEIPGQEYFRGILRRELSATVGLTEK